MLFESRLKWVEFRALLEIISDCLGIIAYDWIVFGGDLDED